MPLSALALEGEMKLKTINKWLRRAGLVFVIEVWDHEGPREPARLWIQRWSSYQKGD